MSSSDTKELVRIVRMDERLRAAAQALEDLLREGPDGEILERALDALRSVNAAALGIDGRLAEMAEASE
jgi:hypothetical protein